VCQDNNGRNSRVYLRIIEGVTLFLLRGQETAAREVGKVNKELQAEHILITGRVCSDVDSKLRRWYLLRKFDGLGDCVVARLDGTLDLHICCFTARNVEGSKPFFRMRK
jgi:hypothetical protein